MTGNDQPKGFIARYEGFCPICHKFIVKGEHMIVKMPEPIKSTNNYYGEERECHYAHQCCYKELLEKEQ